MRQGKLSILVVVLAVLLLAGPTVAGVSIQGIGIDGGALGPGESTPKILVKKEAWGGEYEDARVGDELKPGAFLSTTDDSACLTLFSDAGGEDGSTAAITGKFRIAIAPASAEGLYINLLAGAAVVEGDANSAVETGEAKAASEGTTYQVQILDDGYVCLVFEGRVKVTGYGTTKTVSDPERLAMIPGRRGFSTAPLTSSDINETASILARKDLSLAGARGTPVPDRAATLLKIEERRAVVLRNPTDAEGRIQLVNTLIDVGAVKAVPYQLERVKPLPGNRVVSAQKTLAEYRLGRPIGTKRVDEAMATIRARDPGLIDRHRWIRDISGERPPPAPPEDSNPEPTLTEETAMRPQPDKPAPAVAQPDRTGPPVAIKKAFRLIEVGKYEGAREILVKELRKGYGGADLYIGLALANLGLDPSVDREAVPNGLKALALPPGTATALSQDRIDELVILTGGKWTARTKFGRGWGDEFLRRKMFKAAQDVFTLRLEAGSADARDFFGAGLAAQGLGDQRAASAWMRRALKADRDRKSLTDRHRKQAARLLEER